MEYFDLHCDTVNKYSEKAVPFKDTALKICNDKIIKGQSQCFALFVSDNLSEKDANKKREKLFEKYRDLKFIAENKGITPFLTLENSKGIEDVSLWRKRGVVMASLTWNNENELACGSACQKGGLKDRGKKIIYEFEKNNILLDVSHLNFQSFYDVCSFTDKPIVASHSNCFSLCKHNRNLKDEQIKEIIKRDGLIGLCFYPLFLGRGDVFENIYRNICHIGAMGGENVICFGSDFDGAKMSRKLKDSEDIISLYEFLRSKSMSDELISKIFYKNSEKFFNIVLH